MNLKALITTFVLGSSTMASADSISFSGSVNVSLGGAHAPVRPAPAPTYRPAVPARPVVVVQDPCNEPAPAPVYHPHPTTPVVYQPPAPVWQAPYYNITNTSVTTTGSGYHGRFGVSNIKSVPRASGTWNGYRLIRTTAKPTQAWFDLTEATRIDNGREFFTIGADNGLFNSLQLTGLGNGRSQIKQVLVEYLDNRGTKKAQWFKPNMSLTRTGSPLTLDLDGEYRSISRIVVYGATDAGSAFKISAK